MKPSSGIHQPVIHDFYKNLPKVDLHRHLEGSLRFDTIHELARKLGLNLPATGRLRDLVQVNENENLSFDNFLAKFTTLRLFYRSPEIIERITHEAVADAAADNVRYMELRFTPVALSQAQGFPLVKVIDWVVEGAKKASETHGVNTRLVASVNRHESLPLAAQVSYLAAERQQAGIVGLDLAGDESSFPTYPFSSIFKNARQKGLHITVHAGEWGEEDTISQAIRSLGAERIGHGIQILKNPQTIQLAIKEAITFEVSPTTNYHSGAIPPGEAHPITQMLAAGLNITINSDDPGISQIDLSHEYQFVVEACGFSMQQLRECILLAAQKSFLPEAERKDLVEKITQEIDLQMAAS